MRLYQSLGLGILTVASLAPGRLSAGGNDFKVAATGAARELSKQLFFLQNTISLIPGPPMGRGLYSQCDGVQLDLGYFRDQLKRDVSREQLLLNFDKMDAKLNQLLGDVKNFEKWDDALRMVAKRVQAAGHDLHFALASAGSPANTQQLAYRQTLNLLTKSENFAGMVRYVFAEQAMLAQWNADLAALSGAIAKFQSAQKNNASPQEVKNQLLATSQEWNKLVARVEALPVGQYLLVQSDAAEVDRVLFRLAQITGMKIGRTPLPDPLAF